MMQRQQSEKQTVCHHTVNLEKRLSAKGPLLARHLIFQIHHISRRLQLIYL